MAYLALSAIVFEKQSIHVTFFPLFDLSNGIHFYVSLDKIILLRRFCTELCHTIPTAGKSEFPETDPWDIYDLFINEYTGVLSSKKPLACFDLFDCLCFWISGETSTYAGCAILRECHTFRSEIRMCSQKVVVVRVVSK